MAQRGTKRRAERDTDSDNSDLYQVGVVRTIHVEFKDGFKFVRVEAQGCQRIRCDLTDPANADKEHKEPPLTQQQIDDILRETEDDEPDSSASSSSSSAAAAAQLRQQHRDDECHLCQQRRKRLRLQQQTDEN